MCGKPMKVVPENQTGREQRYMCTDCEDDPLFDPVVRKWTDSPLRPPSADQQPTGTGPGTQMNAEAEGGARNALGVWTLRRSNPTASRRFAFMIAVELYDRLALPGVALAGRRNPSMFTYRSTTGLYG